jgi:hypothetical protein
MEKVLMHQAVEIAENVDVTNKITSVAEFSLYVMKFFNRQEID